MSLIVSIFLVFFGIEIIFIGIEIIFTGKLSDYRSGFIYDIEQVKWSSGLIFIGIGFYIIFLSIKRIIKKRQETQEDKELQKPLICPTCASHFYKDETETMKCPDCNEPLIPLSEYVENKRYRKNNQNDLPK